MKRTWAIPIIVSILILGVIGFSFTQEADAASFTATQSGNWDVAATWGGTEPPTNIQSGDTVIIPSGITVTIPSGVLIDNFGTINNNVGTISTIFTLVNSGTIILTGSAGLLSGDGSISLTNFGTIKVDPSLIERITKLDANLLSGEIIICHGDITKTISVAAFGTHVGHGDTEGACT